MVYMRREMSMFIWSTVALLLGNAGQFVVPLYIGWFVDDMNKGEFDNIWNLVW